MTSKATSDVVAAFFGASADELFMKEAFAELVRARAKFPSSSFSLAALIAEVGDLAEAMLKVSAGKWPKQRVREEALQVVVMGMRLALDGDASFNVEYDEEPSKMSAHGWQPIETAPKDGTRALVSFGERGVHAVQWDSPHYDEVTNENGIWCVDDGKHGPYPLRGYDDKGPKAPTHWMPLPHEPEAAPEHEKAGRS